MTTTDLSTFQTAFAAALMGRSTIVDPDVAQLAAHPAFAVYRNGVLKHAIDAVQANYPTIVRLVGEEWFRAAAREFVSTSPPNSPVLVDYGVGFPDFLSSFDPATALGYLPGVARLDRCWTEAHIAADAPSLDPSVLVSLDHSRLATIVLVPHPAARWRWFEAMPIFTLWHRNRVGENIDDPIDWIAEGALLTRPESNVIWQPIDAAICAFLDTCASGEPLARAAQAALAVNPQTDLTHLMSCLLGCGAFGSVHPYTPHSE